MDSKEGIEKTEPVDARVTELLDPLHLRLGPKDAGASNVDTGTDPLRAGSPPDHLSHRKEFVNGNPIACLLGY